MTTPFLLANPNPHGPHFYHSRQGKTVLAIVLHITAGLEELRGIVDHSAERTARYAATTDRRVSWHSGSDTDSSLDLLPSGYTAFHVQGYNSRTYGHEISKRTADWRYMAPSWVDATLHQAARHLAPKARELGIPLRHATKRELDEAIARNLNPVGFVDHWQLDPGRRSDPGLVGATDTFPWARFLSLVHRYQQPPTPAPQPAPRKSRHMILNIKDSPYNFFIRGAYPDGSLALVAVNETEFWELAGAGVQVVTVSHATFEKVRAGAAYAPQ